MYAHYGQVSTIFTWKSADSLITPNLREMPKRYQKLGTEMAECREGRAYKHYTSNPFPTSFLVYLFVSFCHTKVHHNYSNGSCTLVQALENTSVTTDSLYQVLRAFNAPMWGHPHMLKALAT